jgi:hypothetical protein
VTGTIDVDWEVALRKGYGPLAAGNPKAEGRNPKGEVVDVQEVGPAGMTNDECRMTKQIDGGESKGAGELAPGKEQP